MGSIRVKATFGNGNVLSISRRELWKAGAPRSLRRRIPEIELDPMTFTEGLGIRRHRKLTFQQLKYMRSAFPAVHSSIDFLKSRCMTFPFRIVREDKKPHNNFSQKRADRVEKLLRGPNEFGHTYRQNISMFLDNILERDLGTIELETAPAGGIYQWGVVDSFKMRPNPLNFQGDLRKAAYFEMGTMEPETIVNKYARNEIVWANLNPQAGSFYGYAPLEVLDQIILMGIYSTTHNLKLVHPNSEKGGGIVYLGDVGKNVRREFEKRYALWRMKDPGRPMFTSGGDKEPSYLSMKDVTDMDYPELLYALAEVVASCFQLNLRDIGYSQKGKGSSGTAEIDDTITLKSAIIPRMMIIEDVFTVGLVHPAGGDDLRMQYIVKKDESLESRTRAGNMALGRGGLTLDEYREMIDSNLPPYGPGVGDKPFIVAGNTVILVEDIMSGKYQPGTSIEEIDTEESGENDDTEDKFKRTTQQQTERGVDERWS